MSDRAANNYRWAWALVDALAAAGLHRLVMSPGSRSTPLALAALRHPGLKVAVCLDERAAGFYALGLARAECAPVALLATSGSAVANWMPCVVEADMGRVPLLLLSADRPAELQDCGANQTMDQLGLFGRQVRSFRQLPPAQDETGWLAGLASRTLALCRGPLPGPVHWNIPLAEPLVPAGVPDLQPAARAARVLPSRLQPGREAIGILEQVITSGPGAIVCGPQDLGAEARTALVAFAAKLRVPVFADLLSGLRTDKFAVTGSCDPLLAYPDQVARSAPTVSWLMRLGGTSVSRSLNEWIAQQDDAVQVVISDTSRAADPAGQASHLLQADPAALFDALSAGPVATPSDDTGLCDLQALDAAAAEAAAAVCRDGELFEGSLLRSLLHELPDGSPVFLGNSLTVRSADWFVGRTVQTLRLFGNRGVSGIDGNLATASGIAEAFGPTLAVVGDLTFQHDLNSLALARQHPLTILLLDNGGGGIFDHLAQAALPEFERGWLTPQALQVEHAVRAFGITYRRADDFQGALDAVQELWPQGGVLHVAIDRETSLACTRHFHFQARSLNP